MYPGRRPVPHETAGLACSARRMRGRTSVSFLFCQPDRGTVQYHHQAGRRCQTRLGRNWQCPSERGACCQGLHTRRSATQPVRAQSPANDRHMTGSHEDVCRHSPGCSGLKATRPSMRYQQARQQRKHLGRRHWYQPPLVRTTSLRKSDGDFVSISV